MKRAKQKEKRHRKRHMKPALAMSFTAQSVVYRGDAVVLRADMSFTAETLFARMSFTAEKKAKQKYGT